MPVTPTAKLTAVPALADWLSGCAVMTGGTFTVSAAAAEKFVPAALLTRTR